MGLVTKYGVMCGVLRISCETSAKVSEKTLAPPEAWPQCADARMMH